MAIGKVFCSIPKPKGKVKKDVISRRIVHLILEKLVKQDLTNRMIIKQIRKLLTK